MPVAPVDDQGSVLYYEDSGIPNTSTDYSTLVLIHGTCFHSAGFRPMIPFAADRNLRLVLLNLRGYPGSTPYSSEELDALEGNHEAQEAGLQDRGAEVAAFLCWFIQTERLPPIGVAAEGVKLVGGLSVLSWSGGNGQTLAMFAHADKLPEQTRLLFDKYLRAFILYDPSSSAVGNPPPPGLKTIRVDRTESVEDQASKLATTIASYYPPFVLPNDLSDPFVHVPRPPLQDGTDFIEPKYMPTTSKISPEVLRSITHPPILERAQHLIWSAHMRGAFQRNVEQALYDCRFEDGRSDITKMIWPAVKVHVVWCDMSMGEATWGAAVLHCGYKNAPPEHRRPMEMHMLQGANHFVHWEEPERFTKFLAGIV